LPKDSEEKPIVRFWPTAKWAAAGGLWKKIQGHRCRDRGCAFVLLRF
jgi:hypothetical protein